MGAGTTWLLLAAFLSADTFTWNGDTDGDWGVAANWNAAPTFAAGNDLVFHAHPAGNLSSFLGGSARTIGGLTFNENADSDIFIYTYSNNTGTGGTNRILTFNNGASDAFITVASGAEGDITIAPGGARVTFQTDLVINHNGSGNLSFGQWLGANEATSITKNGSGTLTFESTSPHLYSGGMTITEGRVRVPGTGPFGSGNLEMTGGALSSTGTGNISISNAFDFSNAITLGNATDSGTITFTAAAAGTLKANTTIETASSVVLNSAIGDEGNGFSLTKTGAATLTLGNNANTFSGGLNINGGTVATENADGRLGAASGPLSFDGGTLLWTGGATTGVTRATTVLSGGGTIGVQNPAAQITWNNSITGVGSFTKTGDGVLYMNSSSNTFQSGLSLNGGTFSVANGDNRLGATGGEVSFDGGTLRFHGTGVDMTTSDRTTTLSAGGGTVEVEHSARTITWAGEISGVGSLTKTGAGKLELTRDNSYGGATTVSGGTLLINGNQTVATGSVIVNSGATLGGGGTIGGTTTIDAGATLAPGNSIGTLSTASDVFWNGGGFFDFEFQSDGTGVAGTDWDLFSITGGLDLSGASSGTPFIINLFTMSDATTRGSLPFWTDTTSHAWSGFVTTTDGLTGFSADKFDFDTSGFLNPLNGSFSVFQNGNNLDLVYTAVPEPSTIALIGILLAGTIAWRSRRRAASAS